MDEIKLAFETIIVGLLAIPWILILFHLAFYLIARKSLLTTAREFLADSHQSVALIGPLIIGLAYCGGTILFPIADEYFNKVHRFPVYVKDDDAIRVDTLTKIYFEHEYYHLKGADFPGLGNAEATISKTNTLGDDAAKVKIAAKNKNGDHEDVSLEDVNVALNKKLSDPIHSIYNYQKYYDYNTSNGYEVLKPLQSRIIVLRGAVLNGLFLLGALSLLFLVALIEAILKGSKDRIYGLAIFFMGIIVWGLYHRWGWGTHPRTLLLGALSLLFFVALIEAILKRSKARIQGLVIVLVMGIIVWGLYHQWEGWAVPNIWLLLSALLVFSFVALQIILSRSKEAIHGLVMVLVIGVAVWGLCWWGAWGVAKAEDEYDKHVVGIFCGSKASAPKHPEGGNPGQQKEK